MTVRSHMVCATYLARLADSLAGMAETEPDIYWQIDLLTAAEELYALALSLLEAP